MKKVSITLLLSSIVATHAFSQAEWDTQDYKLKKLTGKLTLSEMRRGDKGMLLSLGQDLCTDSAGKIHVNPEVKVTNVDPAREYATKIDNKSFNLDIDNKQVKPEYLVRWLSLSNADQPCTELMLSNFTYTVNLVGGEVDINKLIISK
ncbi:hypothetical protein C0J08_14665 [Marinomonas sp. CT5]|uniref:hypothetical protein n=1 Tax=Marinomonas sp. CT5 TaxID=2066133 RepID=UPI001BB0972C|nr:hypothetical protein [Marinomonas sp. CT5]QUX96563.1 hypothetical protein C0J08_14665 [Marinomonas sp. CT5]